MRTQKKNVIIKLTVNRGKLEYKWLPIVCAFAAMDFIKTNNK